MEQEIQEILKRLEACERVHTRYKGDRGERGPKGDPGPAGRDGKDSTVVEVNALREERNAVREELNAFRKELHDFRAGVCAEMQQLAANYAQRLSEIFFKEADAFCELRDKSCAEIDERRRVWQRRSKEETRWKKRI